VATPGLPFVAKPNGGKASALNYGIQRAGAEFVLCVDADTNLEVDAIGVMMKYFSEPSVGAGCRQCESRQ